MRTVGGPGRGGLGVDRAGASIGSRPALALVRMSRLLSQGDYRRPDHKSLRAPDGSDRRSGAALRRFRWIGEACHSKGGPGGRGRKALEHTLKRARILRLALPHAEAPWSAAPALEI